MLWEKFIRLLRKRGTYKTMVDDIKGLILKGDMSIEEAVRVLGKTIVLEN